VLIGERVEGEMGARVRIRGLRPVLFVRECHATVGCEATTAVDRTCRPRFFLAQVRDGAGEPVALVRKMGRVPNLSLG
jgi:hypothetical protein